MGTDSYTANGYEAAVATKLLATNCSMCNRPLLDADSVALGIGPICRERYLVEMTYHVDKKQLSRAIAASPAPLRSAIAGAVKEKNWRSMLNTAVWHASMAVSHTGPEYRAVLASAQQLANAVGSNLLADRIKSFHFRSTISMVSLPGGRIGAVTPYNRAFVDAIRKVRGRKFDGGMKLWSVSENMAEHLVAALSVGFPGQLMEDLGGNVVQIPKDVQFPPPETRPAPAPDVATGETSAPPIEEIEKLRKGDKVVDPDGNTRTIGWIGMSRDEWRLGLMKKGERGLEFYSYMDITLLSPSQVATDAAKRYDGEADAASKAGALPPTPPREARSVPDIAFPYQVDGINWLDQKGSGLLADEPGLGKTLQACVAADVPVLIICPAAMRVEWSREMNRWRPDLSVLVVSGKKPYAASRYDADAVVVNYDVVGSHLKRLKAKSWATIIADEAQYLKTLKLSRSKYTGSSRAKAFQILSENVERKFLLTATPIMNRPIELWPLLHILDADRWDSYSSFGKRYCDGKLEQRIVRGGAMRKMWNFTGSSNERELNAILVSSYMLRRTKDILPLPPKSRSTTIVALDSAVAREYDHAAKEFLDWVEKHGGPEKVQKAQSALALTKMTALRKLAAVGKIPYAVDWITGHFVATGRPLVVMAHHRDVTLGIERELRERDVESSKGPRKLRVGKIIGGMSEASRTADKDAFQAGQLDVLVCSIQAAGVGLTLTAASETLFVERAWRPSDLVQAEDRIWRIGQDNKCTITYLDAAGTVDEIIGELLKNKQSTIAGIIDGVDVDEEQAAAMVFGKMFDMVKQGRLKKNPASPSPTIDWTAASVF